MNRRIGILGVTGLVGRTMLALLEERAFPVDMPRLLARDAGAVRRLPWRGGELPVEAVREGCFEGLDTVLFATSNEVSRQWAPEARRAGACVVDNSSAFRYVDEVPLVVPEVNGWRLASRPELVANPNCSTIAVAMALAPLMALGTLARVSVATYQSISGGGSELLERFERETSGRGVGPGETAGREVPVAFNVIPHIDRFEDNGYTREEMKVVWETRKILDLPDLPVSATAVRVPVRVGHCAAVTAGFTSAVRVDDAREAWRTFRGVEVVDDVARGRYPTTLACAGGDAVLVGRARTDLADGNAITFFVASDNLRKGAALNAVQIAESMCESDQAAEAR